MSLMLSLHIVFLLLWSGALLYFPALLAQQAGATDPEARRHAMRVQHLLYAWIMTPCGLLTIAAGTWLVFSRGFSGGWLHVKLLLVLLMVFFHAWCGTLMARFRSQRPTHAWFYRLLPVVPALLITAVVTLVTAKPF